MTDRKEDGRNMPRFKTGENNELKILKNEIVP
jgi:hypothetical protein